MSRTDERVLARTVCVVPEGGGKSTPYFTGTPASEIPADHLAEIRNPKAWVPRPKAQSVAKSEGGIAVREAPSSLDECTDEQLLAIAAREEIPLGRLKKRDKIIEVLRSAGMDNETGDSGPQ